MRFGNEVLFVTREAAVAVANVCETGQPAWRRSLPNSSLLQWLSMTFGGRLLHGSRCRSENTWDGDACGNGLSGSISEASRWRKRQ